MVLLLKRVTAQPETGKLSINPQGRASSTAPNPASLNPNCNLISGIRLAQLAKQIPAIKKKTATDILFTFRVRLACMLQRWHKIAGFPSSNAFEAWGFWSIFAALWLVANSSWQMAMYYYML